MSRSRAQFAAHYRAHADFTWRNLRRLGVPPGDADDATQEVFLVLLRRGETIRPGVPLRSWLFGVIRRIAARYRRSKARRVRLEEALAQWAELMGSGRHDAQDDPERAHHRLEAARLIECFLAELTPLQAEVFILAELEELSGREIAEALEVNQNTVWSRLRLARRCFDRCFEGLRAEVRGETTELSAESSKRSLLALSRYVHRPKPEDRRRVGALLGLPGMGELTTGAPGANAAPLAPSPPPVDPVFVGSALTGGVVTGSPLAGLVGAAVLAGLFFLAGRSESTPAAPSSPRSVALDHTAEESAQLPPSGSASLESVSYRPRAGASEEPPSPDPRGATAEPKPRPPFSTPSVEKAAVSAQRETASPGRLREEAALLEAARRALARSDPERALSTADAHRLRFPGGILAREREGLRIIANCRLGHTSEAKHLASALSLTSADPGIVQQLLKDCRNADSP